MRTVAFGWLAVLLCWIVCIPGYCLSPGYAAMADVRTVAQDEPAQARNDYKRIFESIQQGLADGNVGEFSRHLGSHVLVNLQKGESGYYSASQAYYVLESYLKNKKVISFRFTTIGESEANPYATGGAGINVKGVREFIQVYVSLSWAGDRWVISQINIY